VFVIASFCRYRVVNGARGQCSGRIATANFRPKSGTSKLGKILGEIKSLNILTIAVSALLLQCSEKAQ
jgi:hypothetical protein